MAIKVQVGGERTFSRSNITAELPDGDRVETVRMDATFRAQATGDVTTSGKLNVAEYCERVVVSVDKVVGIKFTDESGQDVTLTGNELRSAVLSVFECASALRQAHVDAITKGVARKN